MRFEGNKMRGRLITDYLFKGGTLLISSICAVPLVLILYFIVSKGIAAINWQFFVNIPAPVGEKGGGILNDIIGTLMLVVMAAVIAVPLAVIAGVYLSENKDTKTANLVRFCAEILQGVPSIVIGVIAYIWVVKPFHHFSAISGSIALAIMMLPVIIRTTEETINMVPNHIKEGSLALGVPYYKTMLRIIIPCGYSGIISGVIISIARIAGETAPLLFTSFGNPYISYNPTKPIGSLPQTIFLYAMSPYADWIQQAWGASFILLSAILIISLISKFLTRRWKIQF